ncbi:MAG: hypothetical protein LBP55_00470 [Candidatus Adiutrix sp.]|jgi:REP element-mobilizing transposase RayT|nr:hypothetical protein [Candidatus Adiutrix sp.]
MAQYNPETHHRRSIRLKEYDYSQCGAYFITICCQSKQCLFGEINTGKMQLNEAGMAILKWYKELPNKFTDIKICENIIMPNHTHAIIVNVGADLCVCPDAEYNENVEHAPRQGEHAGSPLPRMLQWFKTMTTNEYIRGVKDNGWKRFDGKLWQRNYYEHIIRNDDEYLRIANYVINNPLNWEEDNLWTN